MEEEDQKLDPKQFSILQDQYFKLLNKVYLLALRKEDDRKQALKGQPSLDLEDTGVQYKNDVV